MGKLSLIFLLLTITVLKIHAQTDTLYLWPGKVPGESEPKSSPVIDIHPDGETRVVKVTNPFLAVFLPEADKKNHKGVIVCPGGAYTHLAVHKEGFTTAEWLTKLGYTVFVLEYRVPNDKSGALQDIQRAFRLVRYLSGKYGIDPGKIGGIGFSAGADLVARCGLTDPDRTYPVQDAADSFPCRPNCMMIMYPGYLDMGPNKTLTPYLHVTAKTVPAFIFQAMDDPLVTSSFDLAMAFQKSGAPCELHIVPKGGHGYGMYPGNPAAEAWPPLLENWLSHNF